MSKIDEEIFVFDDDTLLSMRLLGNYISCLSIQKQMKIFFTVACAF